MTQLSNATALPSSLQLGLPSALFYPLDIAVVDAPHQESTAALVVAKRPNK